MKKNELLQLAITMPGNYFKNFEALNTPLCKQTLIDVLFELLEYVPEDKELSRDEINEFIKGKGLREVIQESINYLLSLEVDEEKLLKVVEVLEGVGIELYYDFSFASYSFGFSTDEITGYDVLEDFNSRLSLHDIQYFKDCINNEITKNFLKITKYKAEDLYL